MASYCEYGNELTSIKFGKFVAVCISGNILLVGDAPLS
jgi:hypothetical protein